jgi:DNA topoisomerase-1
MRGREFLSVGRVQTPTLALLVERDREAEEFVPQPYWVVTATIGDPPLTATHASERFWQRDEADAAQGRAELAEEASVTDYSVRAIEGHRPPPFNTTSFLAEATRLGLTAAKAKSIAEDLYRAGHLSYPRTDNTVYPSSLNLRAILERLRESDLAAEAEEVLAQESLRPSRGPMETTDHPPIYPTSGARRDKLKADAWRLYELVARRFLATLAPLASERDTVAEFDVGGETFFSRGRKIVDPGWRKYYGSQGSHSSVPALAVGDRLPILAVVEEQRQTDPPPRYSQGHVIEEMERLGLGTKSTRHEIVQKLYDRGYVEGRSLRATAAGRAVVEALEAHGGQVTRPEMTVKLDGAMDAIATGSRSLEDVVEESRALLASVLSDMSGHATGIAAWVRTAIANEVEVGTCEKCGGVMLIRKARTGHRFLGCSKFPECRNTRALPKTGLLVPSLEVCERCGSRKLAHVHRGIANVWCATPTCSDAELTRILGV